MQHVTDGSMFQLCLNVMLIEHICESYKPKHMIVDLLYRGATMPKIICLVTKVLLVN